MIHTKKLQEPVFCFTSDLDWNSDTAIEATLDAFARANAKLTVFATHQTPVVRRHANVQVGVHPNFLPGSTHGATQDAVIDHVFGLYPDAQTYRSHSYFDNQLISEQMHRRGIRYDANLSLYLQEGLGPLHHCHDSWRFPTFFDDNVHWFHDGKWDFKALVNQITTPGLKIFNFHPYPVALNIPTREYYQSKRALLKSLTPDEVDRHRFRGQGPRNFIEEMLEFISKRFPTHTLGDLYDQLTMSADPAPAIDVAGRPTMSQSYSGAGVDDRKKLVLDQYEKMDATNIYITSRDFHLRELEISSIARCMEEVDARKPSVLDCGCGNGYTLLSLGKRFPDARLVGVDFSQNLIGGARSLTERFRSELKSVPEFVCRDIFDFLDKDEEKFDFIITERVIVNLPTEELQDQVVLSLLGKLAVGGRYLMVEGAREGFESMNEARRRTGLAEIPDTYPGNESSRKLDSGRILSLAAKSGCASVVAEENFSFYNLVSKTVHPLLVAPEEPKFAARINEHAAQVQRALHEMRLELPDFGAGKIWVIRKDR